MLGPKQASTPPKLPVASGPASAVSSAAPCRAGRRAWQLAQARAAAAAAPLRTAGRAPASACGAVHVNGKAAAAGGVHLPCHAACEVLGAQVRCLGAALQQCRGGRAAYLGSMDIRVGTHAQVGAEKVEYLGRVFCERVEPVACRRLQTSVPGCSAAAAATAARSLPTCVRLYSTAAPIVLCTAEASKGRSLRCSTPTRPWTQKAREQAGPQAGTCSAQPAAHVKLCVLGAEAHVLKGAQAHGRELQVTCRARARLSRMHAASSCARASRPTFRDEPDLVRP